MENYPKWKESNIGDTWRLSKGPLYHFYDWGRKSIHLFRKFPCKKTKVLTASAVAALAAFAARTLMCWYGCNHQKWRCFQLRCTYICRWYTYLCLKKASFLPVPKCPNKSSFSKYCNLLRYLEVAEVMGFFAEEVTQFRVKMTCDGPFSPERHPKKETIFCDKFPATLESGLGRVGYWGAMRFNDCW